MSKKQNLIESAEQNLINNISELLNEYENKFNNEKIVGCIIEIGENNFYEWDGEKMASKPNYTLRWVKCSE